MRPLAAARMTGTPLARGYSPTAMTDDARRNSRVMLDGPDRAPARAMMRAVGYTDADFRKPLVGVAHAWLEITPCNANHRRLAERVKEGIRAAGGAPVEC